MSDEETRFWKHIKAAGKEEQYLGTQTSDHQAETVIIRNGVAKGYPWVKGVCPACGGRTLFVGNGGYVTCSYIPCPDPGAAGKLLETKNV